MGVVGRVKSLVCPRGNLQDHRPAGVSFFAVSASPRRISCSVVEVQSVSGEQPAIKATINVYSRRCSGSLIALAAEAVVTNTSRVRVEIPQCSWVVNKIAPYEDILPSAEWETCWRSKQRNFTLEPGETDTISMRARIDDCIEAVDVVLLLDQSNEPQNDRSRHWVYRHPHDLCRS